MKVDHTVYEQVQKLLASRRDLRPSWQPGQSLDPEAEGGCGVTGFAASVPVSGRHIFQPSVQMHNRGNGKGGGIAAVGLDPDSLGSPRKSWTTTISSRSPSWIPKYGTRWRKNSSNPSSGWTAPAAGVHHSDWRDLPA
jgi:hypothetical protein